MFDKMVPTTLSVVGKLAENASAVRADSLIEFGKVTRVEPVTLVDQMLFTQPVLTDVLQSLNSIFAAYYLQAVSLSTKVGNIDVIKLLEPLNPNRDVVDAGATFIGEWASTESFQYALPVPGETVGLEAYGDSADVTSTSVKVADLTNVANLSIGKLLEVEVNSGGQKAKIPVAVRLIVSGIASDLLAHTLSLKSKDTSVKERYHAWKAGMLSTIKDMVLCQDLVDEHRKALMKDKTGFYRENISRDNKNTLTALLTGRPSLSTASNIVVMSQRTAKQVEIGINGRLKDFGTREKVFRDSYVMLMAVVDVESEMLTIYHRSIDTPTTLSFRDIKGASKDTSVDITKILQAFLSGNSPHL